MNSKIGIVPKPVVVGACLALLTMLLGFLLGVSFGAKESSIMAHLDKSGTAALQSVYNGDNAAKDMVVKKSWVYLKRAHLHQRISIIFVRPRQNQRNSTSQRNKLYPTCPKQPNPHREWQ